MAISLVQAQAITDLALQLVDWLPGSTRWNTYTFADAAAQNGVAEFWSGGSKRLNRPEFRGDSRAWV